jgi:dynein assembly factor 1, axonemal
MKLHHDKPRKPAEVPKDGHGQPYISKEYLRALCAEIGLFETPHVNTKLYLHFKGFKKIQGLDEYCNLQALWLEGNGLEGIRGLDKLTQMTTLYLHQNQIPQITGLETMTKLVTLNLSHNRISKVEGLSQCQMLKTLDLSHNLITDLNDCTQLLQLKSLTHLDLKENQIDQHTEVVPFFR